MGLPECTPFHYSDTDPPPEYRCATCDAHGVRLYRDYSTFAHNARLTCTACTETAEKRRAEGKAHAIGWRVAAVPTEDGGSYWGYTSVPEAGVTWWDTLPVRVLA